MIGVDSSGESEGEAKSARTIITTFRCGTSCLDSSTRAGLCQPACGCWIVRCGAGPFSLQCYGKLIERRLQELGRRLRPAELGRLLTHHIFGVDIDEDACKSPNSAGR